MGTPRCSGRLLLLSVVMALLLPGCSWWPFGPDDVDEGVSADTVFWRAYSDPGTFDAWLGTQTVSGKAAGCLENRSRALFDLSESKLRECGQLVSGTSTWTACHQEREQYNNGGVIARDLAQTLRRTTRFDQTDAGRYLIALRSAIGSSDWNAVIDLARRNLPPVQCD